MFFLHSFPTDAKHQAGRVLETTTRQLVGDNTCLLSTLSKVSLSGSPCACGDRHHVIMWYHVQRTCCPHSPMAWSDGYYILTSDLSHISLNKTMMAWDGAGGGTSILCLAFTSPKRRRESLDIETWDCNDFTTSSSVSWGVRWCTRQSRRLNEMLLEALHHR